MKKLYTLAFIVVFVFMSTINALAGATPYTGSNCHTVGAPLDGGLLAILAIAGAAYFTARKRKKSQE